MRRGRGQVLYRFLPEQVVDYSDKQVIGKVAKWYARELTGIDMNRLMSEVASRASRFGKRIEGFPRGWKPTDFVLLEPTSLELDLFPLTFFCKACGRAVRFKSVREFRTATSRHNYHCPRCHSGELQQSDIVHYHTCGTLESLVVPRCNDHDRAEIHLEKFGSNAIKRWMWQCRNAAHPHGYLDLVRVGGHCFNHPAHPNMSHAPFRQSDVFYPESVTIVNVPSLGSATPIDDRIWKLVLGEYLELVPAGTSRRVASGGQLAASALVAGEARERLIRQGFEPADVDRIVRALDLPADAEALSGALSAVDRMLHPSDTTVARLASQIYAYQQIVAMESTMSIADVARRAEGPTAERVREAPEKLHSLGFADAFVTTDFPLIKVVFGYSRGDPERLESTLRAFPRNEAFPQKAPIYGARIQTEAIVLRLDLIRVWKWLRENGWVPESQPTGETEMKAWLLNNVSLGAIPVFEEISSTSTVTKWTYRLIHSLSHVLLTQASSIVGIDRNSLGEVLFPAIPALAIYVSSSQEFQLGGMYTLFENAVSSWLEVAAEEVTTCLHDPVCIETETACFACMFLAEVSCEHFNRELGRDVLIGRQVKSPARGFWTG